MELNELLRRAMMQEQYEKLAAEAAEFFGDGKAERAGAKAQRAEAKAFQKASLRTLGRD